jgi:hypothetical protein
MTHSLSQEPAKLGTSPDEGGPTRKSLSHQIRMTEKGSIMRYAFTALLLAVAQPLAGQIVRGQIVDSISGGSIAGGVVALLDDRGAELARTLTDENGLFLLRAEAPGRYRLRASHEAYHESTFPPFALGNEEVKAFVLLVPPLSAPEPPDVTALIERVCPNNANAGLPILLGRLQDADGNPVADGELTVRWSALPDALTQFTDAAVSEGVVMSGPTGVYAVCGVPQFTPLTMQARKGDLESGVVRLVFGRRTVTVGERREDLLSLLWRQDFTLLAESERTASLVGRVTDINGRPVPEADVLVVGTGYASRTDAEGVFELAGLPPGPTLIAVRRLGFRRLQTEVRLELDAEVALPDSALQLEYLPTELEPVVITAAAHRKREQVGFERRRKQMTGRFTTREEFIDEGVVPVTSEVLRKLGGFSIRWTKDFTPLVYSQRRGGICFPLVFRDNLFLGTTDPTGGVTNLDAAVPLEQVDAIEVYNGGALPSEFNRTGSVCGAIVFWTTPPKGQR